MEAHQLFSAYIIRERRDIQLVNCNREILSVLNTEKGVSEMQSIAFPYYYLVTKLCRKHQFMIY